MDDTFVIWQVNNEELQDFLFNINKQRPSNKFTMKKEEKDQLPFLF